MSARNWDYDHVWSKPKLLGGHWSGPAMPERWVASAVRNAELGYWHHPFVQSFLSADRVGGSFSHLCRDKQGFQPNIPACFYIWALLPIWLLPVGIG